MTSLNLNTPYYSYQAKANASSVQFGGLRDGLFSAFKTPSEGADVLEKTAAQVASDEKPSAFAGGGLKNGFKRMINKTFKRPTGWAQLLLALLPGHVGLVFIAKSFVEGLLGADSLIVPRVFGAKPNGGRTIIGNIKRALFGGAKAEA